MGKYFDSFAERVQKLATGTDDWTIVAKQNHDIRIKQEAFHPFLKFITYNVNIKELAGKLVEIEFDDDGLKRTNTPTDSRVPTQTTTPGSFDYAMTRGELDILLEWDTIDHYEETCHNQRAFDTKIVEALLQKFSKCIVKVGFIGTSRASSSIGDLKTFDRGWRQRLFEADASYVMTQTASGVKAGAIVIEGDGAPFDHKTIDNLVVETVGDIDDQYHDDLAVLMGRSLYTQRASNLWSAIGNRPSEKDIEIIKNTLGTCGGLPVIPPSITKSFPASSLWVVNPQKLLIYQHRKVRKAVKDTEENNGRSYFNTWHLDFPIRDPESMRICENIEYAGSA